MRKLVGALAAVAMLVSVFPAASSAAGYPPLKYGVELQLGGGYHSLADVNAFVPATSFSGLIPELEINMGMQFGLGLLYRQQHNFGWQFGYSRFVSLMDTKYRITDAPRFPESWAEQTVAGSELSALATWFWPCKLWDRLEMSLGVGPALYNATMDRSIDIAQDGGSHLTSGSFSDASGKSFGFLGALGWELPFGDNLGLSLQLGGRYAKIGKLTYKDSSDQDVTVYLNSASNATMPVDFSGFFLKVGLRGYFAPAADWRSPVR